MDYQREDILTELERRPGEYAAECERRYEKQIARTAEMIYNVREKNPIVLIAGPSASGKTTTAIKLTKELEKLGIGSAAISMDSYFIDYDPETAPRAPDGSRDMESPLCLDIELMGNHFRELTKGNEIEIPTFDFGMERRDPEKVRHLRLGKNEVAIIEGINAMSDAVTEFQGVYSFKIFVSVDSQITDGDRVIYSPQTARLLRRMIRDYNYRAASPEYTLLLWKNVLRGERIYIEPNRGKADVEIDSFLPYEISVMKRYCMELISGIEELADAYTQLAGFPDVEEDIIKPDSLLREFIGGSIYNY